jgi:uncharacterized membrane protein YczE
MIAMKILPDFLSVKTIPTLFWSSPKALTIRPPIVSIVMLSAGLIIFGLGEAMLIASGSGVSPWTVLGQGITNVTGWSIGTATFVISIAVLVLWVPLKQTPGIGTVLNAVIIAFMIDLSLPYLPEPKNNAFQVAQAFLGVAMVGCGSSIYLIANLGPGPRDGLMTGLQKLTKMPFMWIRAEIEVTVVIVGWSLGGVVGVGTLIFALGIGPAVSASLFGLNRLFGRPVS